MALYRVTVMPEPVTYTIEAPTDTHAAMLAQEWYAERSWTTEVSEPLCPCQCPDMECPEEAKNCGECFKQYVLGEE